MYEAMEHAAHAGLDNLTAIVDVNRLGQTGETMHGWDLEAYVRRAQAAGWHAIAIDGHDVDEIDHAYADAAATELRPTMILARTEKGAGLRRGQPERVPRQAARRPGRRHRRAGRAALHPRHGQPARPSGAATGAGARGRPPPRLRARHDRGDARARTETRSRRWAAPGPRSSPSTVRSATRPTPRSTRGAPGSVLRDVHRRAAAGSGRGGNAGPRLATLRLDVRRLPDPGYDFIRMAAVSRANMAWSARMPVSRLARTGHPRWRSRTWP